FGTYEGFRQDDPLFIKERVKPFPSVLLIGNRRFLISLLANEEGRAGEIVVPGSQGKGLELSGKNTRQRSTHDRVTGVKPVDRLKEDRPFRGVLHLYQKGMPELLRRLHACPFL